MLYPTFFDDDFMDDFDKAFEPARNPLYGRRAKNLMKTDVHETDNAYELYVDLPGFKKDEIALELENGYLTISTEKAVTEEDKDKASGRLIRQERYTGDLSRSFYVGDEIRPDEISASYENGVLRVVIPKKTTPKEPERRSIEIN